MTKMAGSILTASTSNQLDQLHNSKQYEKKCSEETQTLRAGCSKAEPKIFARRRPTSWVHRTAKI